MQGRIFHRPDWASAQGHQPIGGHQVIKLMTRPLKYFSCFVYIYIYIYYFAGRANKESLFCCTQNEIFWRMWEIEQFWGTIDFHSIFFSYYGSQWCPKIAWLQTFFKILYLPFVFSRTKTFILVWNYLVVNDDRIFIFWVNYPFNYTMYTERI